jgi:uncharacterized sulfatase
MKRRQFVQTTTTALAALTTPRIAFGEAGRKRPNILWLTCEDMSPFLGCYGDPQARTPNLDKLAAAGIRYENAFSVCPVCAPSRSSIITGVYPSSLGTLHHRSQIQLPDHVRCFPEYLRNAGYYCTNNQKEDYNFKTPPTAWDESSGKAHFRNRPDKSQPFFAVFNFTITHESKIGTLPKDFGKQDQELLEGLEPHDPSRMSVPPYYPDTEVIRRHWAHTYDLITAMDRQAGKVLQELAEDGLAEETVVFFFSDHGIGAPRGKRWLYDPGTHVPMIVRWPGHIQPGSTTDRLMSFIDLAPTVLSIAGARIPDHMQGTPFLGEAEGPPRNFLFCTRDRMDERYDTIRAVRNKRFKYIRNFEPKTPYDQPLTYPESFPIMQELRRVKAESGLVGPQNLLFLQEKPSEELYDTAQDPFELNNLAKDPGSKEILDALRAELERWMMETRDLGLLPEFELADWLARGGKGSGADRTPSYPPLTPSDENSELFGRSANAWMGDLNSPDQLVRCRGAKALAILEEQAAVVLLKALEDPDPVVAYWAGRGLGDGDSLSDEALLSLQRALARKEAGPRLGSAYALVRHGKQDLAFSAALDLVGDLNPFVRLGATEILELIGIQNAKAAEAFERCLADKNDYVVRRAKRILGIPGR